MLVVEHDEETIRRADYVIDLGPGAGLLGGGVVASGTPKQIMDQAGSVTGPVHFRAKKYCCAFCAACHKRQGRYGPGRQSQ